MARDPFRQPNPETDLASRIVRRLAPATMLGGPRSGQPGAPAQRLRLALTGAPPRPHITPRVAERGVESLAPETANAGATSVPESAAMTRALGAADPLDAAQTITATPTIARNSGDTDVPASSLRAIARAAPVTPMTPPRTLDGSAPPVAPRPLPFSVAQVQAALQPRRATEAPSANLATGSPVKATSDAATLDNIIPGATVSDAPQPVVRRSHLEEVTQPNPAAPPRVPTGEFTRPTAPPSPTMEAGPPGAVAAASDSNAPAPPVRRTVGQEPAPARPAAPPSPPAEDAMQDAPNSSQKTAEAAPDVTPSGAPAPPVRRSAMLEIASPTSTGAPPTLAEQASPRPAPGLDLAATTGGAETAPSNVSTPPLRRSANQEAATPGPSESPSLLDDAVLERGESETADSAPTQGALQRAPDGDAATPSPTPGDHPQAALTSMSGPAPELTPLVQAPALPSTPASAPTMRRAPREPSAPAPNTPASDLGVRYRAALEEYRQEHATPPNEPDDAEPPPTSAAAPVSAIAPAANAPASLQRAVVPDTNQHHPATPAPAAGAAPSVASQDNDTPTPQSLSLSQALFGETVVRRTVADRPTAPQPAPVSPAATAGPEPGASRAATEPAVQVHYIQRAVEQETTNTSETEAAPAENAAPQEVDLNRLTEQVYQRLRRRLQVEAERLGWANRQ